MCAIEQRQAFLGRESDGAEAGERQTTPCRPDAAFVTHGGMNSVNESLFHGVPVVVVPQMSEQDIVGRRVEELGAGLYLAKEEATAQRLRESVERLLADDGFRQQAAVVRQSFQSAGGVARAADAILAFTRPQGGI